MFARSAAVLGIAISFAVSLPATAQESFERAYWADQFRGFTGIVLQCDIEPDQTQTRELCDRAAVEAGFLASVAGIPFVNCGVCPPWERFQVTGDAGIRYPLELQLWLRGPDSFQYGAVQLRAGLHYTSAVEAQALPSEPTAHPKSGFLALWQSGTMTFQCSTGCVPELADGVEMQLTAFFTAYNNALQEP